MFRLRAVLLNAVEMVHPRRAVDDAAALNRVVYGRAAVAAAVSYMDPAALRGAEMFVSKQAMKRGAKRGPQPCDIVEAFTKANGAGRVHEVDGTERRNLLDDQVRHFFDSGHLYGKAEPRVYHEGVALVLPEAASPFREVVPIADSPAERAPIYVAVDAVGVKPEDLGGVIKTAAAYGIDGVMVSGAKAEWKYPMGIVASASEGASFQIPLYDIGDVFEYVQEMQNEQHFVGVYNRTANRQVVSLAEFAATGALESKDAALADNRPWVLLTGLRPDVKIAPTAIRPRQELLPMCTTAVKLNARNSSFFPLSAGAAMLIDAAHTAREALWPEGGGADASE